MNLQREDLIVSAETLKIYFDKIQGFVLVFEMAEDRE